KKLGTGPGSLFIGGEGGIDSCTSCPHPCGAPAASSSPAARAPARTGFSSASIHIHKKPGTGPGSLFIGGEGGIDSCTSCPHPCGAPAASSSPAARAPARTGFSSASIHINKKPGTGPGSLFIGGEGGIDSGTSYPHP